VCVFIRERFLDKSSFYRIYVDLSIFYMKWESVVVLWRWWRVDVNVFCSGRVCN